MQKVVEIDSRIIHKTNDDADVKVKASNQWAILKHLENELNDKEIPNSNSVFKDDKWTPIYHEGSPNTGDEVRFLGSTYNEHPATKLLAKMFCYEYGFIQRKVSFSTVSHYSLTVKKILAELTSIGVYSAKKDNYIVGLSALNDNDLLHLIDKTVFRNSRDITTMKTRASWLYSFLTYCGQISNRFPGATFYLEMPWETLNLSLEEWVEQRASDLNILIKEKDGYEALSPDIYIPLINSSFALNENIESTIEINKLISDKHNRGSQGRVIESLRKSLYEKYKDEYESIYPMRAAPLRKREMNCDSHVPVIMDGWLSEIISLTKTANYLIILLTTGLRSSDLANLKVGCCVTSGTIDSLYYLVVPRIQKTKNRLHIPVPRSTYDSVKNLEALKLTENDYLFDEIDVKTKKTMKLKGVINKRLRDFARTFNIPFDREDSGKEYSAHCFRSTVAGFLAEHSNMSILMIRRLFGHSNDIMPSFYQRNNPLFRTQQEQEHEELCRNTAAMMAKAVSEGKVSGPKGEELKNGYEHFVENHNEIFPNNKSQSLTDLELRQSFEDIIYERFIDETACGFLTPLGVICMNNTNNPEPTPCGKRATRNITDAMNDGMSDLLDTYSVADPSACVGAACSEAIIGPWSITLQESLEFNKRLLKHELGDRYEEQHYIDHAQAFIRTYEPLLKPCFDDNGED